MPTAIDQLRVVEVRGSAAGGYAGRLFAGWGAHVTLAAPDGNSPARPDDEALDLYLDHAKHHSEVDRVELDRLVGDADVVIESSSPSPLDPIVPGRPGLVRIHISSMGRDGPLAERWSTELTDQARSGHLLLNGEPEREPISGPRYQVCFAAGLHGFIGATAALAGADLAAGCTVDVGHLQVMASLHQFTLIRRINGGDLLRRMGNRWAGPGRPCGLYRCVDGFVSIIVPRDDQLERMLAVTDLMHLLATPGIEHAYDLMHHPSLLDDHLRPWFAAQRVAEAVELLQAVRVPAAPVSTMSDLLDDPHLADRESLVEVAGVRLPGPPARIDRVAWRTAPGASSASPAPVRPTTPPPTDVSDAPPRPLEGLRIVDLTRVWAGPLATRILADLGADVIMVEAPWARGGPTIDHASVVATAYYPDNDPGAEHWNRIGFVNKYALGKRSVAIDLSEADGRDALGALITTADVVIENFSPRVMPQLGFDEKRLLELQPDLIYVTMPGYGRSGPDRDRVAYGPIVEAHAGLATLMGYPKEPARSAGVAWPDPIAGLHAAAATLAAVLGRGDRRRSGVVEVAQIEATIAMVGAALVRCQLDEKLPVAAGNRHPTWPVQAVLRCAGEDRWVAISVVDGAGWTHVADAINAEPAARSNADELQSALEWWAASRSQDTIVDALAADGVAVAPVADAQQVLDDPQLAATDAWASSHHPAAGDERWPRTAIRLDGRPLEPRRPAPMLGEHNSLLVDEAGCSRPSYDRLTTAGTLATRPPE
jgi:crotonobetainyl-CoA:carnitine CoA-transferase CaiB-like acyl-CoA transferase